VLEKVFPFQENEPLDAKTGFRRIMPYHAATEEWPLQDVT
jgi:hypothetical protein